jgi:hypothetical protein
MDCAAAGAVRLHRVAGCGGVVTKVQAGKPFDHLMIETCQIRSDHVVLELKVNKGRRRQLP